MSNEFTIQSLYTGEVKKIEKPIVIVRTDLDLTRRFAKNPLVAPKQRRKDR